ncbi:hypothetical protein [Cryobacterium gelidum]|uniref:Uncharacterized protein n=1 Tax=Cryobacterium gelidum TaxID=1259164 RepID=A0A4R9AY39_9MICO|nr:hypothetical protein [Cryobacterium gelidum]TFD72726.1 hypothetical protein E3T50_05275 [Cryobacterium gelidum]
MIDAAVPKIDDVVEARNSLKGIADEQLSPDDLKLRNRLLTSTETMLADNDIATLRLAADVVDARYASYSPQLQAGADGVVEATLTPSVYSGSSKFREDFEEVTAELVVDAACQGIFNVIVPDERPEEPGRGSEWTNAGTQAVAKLVARQWTSNTFVTVVNWAYYAQSIGEQGEQLAASTRDAPDSNAVQLLARPPVAKALIQYSRLCYSPPRTVN